MMQRISYFFEKRIENMLMKYRSEMIKMISAWIVTDISYGKKYKLTHEFDPVGDRAGRLQVSQDNLLLEEFECFGEFLTIYSGKSIVSHLPGRRLFHLTYEDKYIERLNKHFMEIFDKEYITEEQMLVKEKLNSSFFLEDEELAIAEELAEIEVYLKSSVSHLLDELKDKDLKWFYTKGVFGNEK